MQTITVTTTRYAADSSQISQNVSHMATVGAGTSIQVAGMMFEIMDHTQDVSIRGNEIKVREANGETIYYVYSVSEDS